MKTYPVTLLEIGLLTGTRATAGAGLALVIANKLSEEQRKAAGWALFGVGCALYFALVANVLLRNKGVQAPPHPDQVP
jgi:hypothetical protein